MYCRNCGTQINDTDTYCFNCGSPQTARPVNNVQPIYFNEKPKSVVKKPWFWLIIVVAVFSILSNAISIFGIIGSKDFLNEYNEDNPFSYYEFFEDEYSGYNFDTE